MNLINYSDSVLSFLVPLVTIILAISTGRVVVSLLSGAVLGAFMLNGFSMDAVSYIFMKLKDIFISDGSIDLWTLNIFLFLILLGSMTALLTLNGATSAFAHWAHKKVKSRRGASLLTVALGVILFIDDYFNALGVGAVSRPVTDSFKISRAKLAYLIDSTSAPMVILTPVSSWGGYIIALLGTTFAAHQIDIGSLSAYVQMIPMNFYAILTIILVIYTAYSNFNIALMVQHEERALEGHLYYEGAGAPESTINIKEGKNGRVFELFLAVFILVFVTIAALVYTGYSAMNGQGHEFGLIEALEASDVGLSLVYGSGSALLTALLFTLGKGLNWLEIIKTVAKGSFTMKDALVVLTAAWLIGAVIKDIHTGQYIASIVEEHLNLALLPALIFTLSAIMAFATGTSWGTFGIMIAITVNIATASDPEQMLVLLSAVLSGAVMGDHCSPISDTTILSSIGARSNHIDHVKTQLPYALLSGSAALCGFLVLGMTESLALAWLAAFALFLVLIAGLKKLYPASA
jgi:tetracycline resistance efflux pump